MDVLLAMVLIAVIIALTVTLISRLRLKHEVAAARSVTDRVVQDITRTDASDAWHLGDSRFQTKHSETQLKALFSSVNQIATGTPTAERQIVANSTPVDTVYIIYKYPGKTPYYIRVAVGRTAGSQPWRLTGISGDTDEASLIIK